MLHFIILLLSFYSSFAFALNDWKKPCLNDECHWDMPEGSDSSGSLRVWTDQPGGISDITPAAGWHILDCDPNKSAQDIRIVCAGGAKAADCQHVMQGGTDGKLIRLPESCGKGPFAVISKDWIHANQTVPGKLNKRDAAAHPVRGMSIHMTWSKVVPKAGPVNIELMTFNAPGYNAETSFPSGGLGKRGIFDKLKDIGKKIVNGVKDVGKKIEDAGKKVVDGVKKGAEKISQATAVNFDKNLTKSIDINFNKNLINLQTSCPPAQLNIKVDASSKSHADVTLGALAKGTVIPPKFDDFALFAGLTADIDGKLIVNAQATGALDSGQKRIFEIGIPGLDIPGIFRIGPDFSVNVQTKAQLDVALQFEVDLAYKVDKAILFFPSNDKHKSEPNFKPANSPLKLASGSNINSKLSLEAHLIPRIEVGISALGNAASANIFVQLDASAKLDLTFQGTVGGATPKAPAAAPPKAVAGGAAPPKGKIGTVVQPKTGAGVTAPKGKIGTVVKPKPLPKGKIGTVVLPKPAMKKPAAPKAPAAKPMMHAAAAPKAATAKPMMHPAANKAAAQPAKQNVQAAPAAKVKRAAKKAAAKAPAPAKAGKGKTSGVAGKVGNAANNLLAGAGISAGVSAGGAPAATAPTPAAKGGVNGCVDLIGGLVVSAGADANFFSFFNKQTSIIFFQKNFQIFKKCFGNGQKRELQPPEFLLYPRPRHALISKRAGLTCPGAGAGILQSLVSTVVSNIPAI